MISFDLCQLEFIYKEKDAKIFEYFEKSFLIKPTPTNNRFCRDAYNTSQVSLPYGTVSGSVTIKSGYCCTFWTFSVVCFIEWCIKCFIWISGRKEWCHLSAVRVFLLGLVSLIKESVSLQTAFYKTRTIGKCIRFRTI